MQNICTETLDKRLYYSSFLLPLYEPPLFEAYWLGYVCVLCGKECASTKTEFDREGGKIGKSGASKFSNVNGEKKEIGVTLYECKF